MASPSSRFGFETTADDVIAVLGAHAKGRTFLITGPSPGSLGEETALAFARAGAATLILVGRAPERFVSVADTARALGAAVRVYSIDLSSLGSVRAGAAKILAETERIDVLVNNAGVSGLADKQFSVDGVELMFATNHLGPFLLTNLLMPVLMKSDAPRIVTLSSGVQAAGTGDYLDYNYERKEYKWFQAYGESKLASIHFTQYLAQFLSPHGVVALAVNPGTIWGTSIIRDLPKDELLALQKYAEGRKVIPKTVAQGASTTLVAALDPAAKEYNGAFLADCAVQAPVGEPATRFELAVALWKLSERLVGQEFVY